MGILGSVGLIFATFWLLIWQGTRSNSYILGSLQYFLGIFTIYLQNISKSCWLALPVTFFQPKKAVPKLLKHFGYQIAIFLGGFGPIFWVRGQSFWKLGRIQWQAAKISKNSCHMKKKVIWKKEWLFPHCHPMASPKPLLKPRPLSGTSEK